MKRYRNPPTPRTKASIRLKSNFSSNKMLALVVTVKQWVQGTGVTKAELDAASAQVSEAFHLCPSLDVLIPALREGGLEELNRRCTLTAGKAPSALKPGPMFSLGSQGRAGFDCARQESSMECTGMLLIPCCCCCAMVDLKAASLLCRRSSQANAGQDLRGHPRCAAPASRRIPCRVQIRWHAVPGAPAGRWTREALLQELYAAAPFHPCWPLPCLSHPQTRPDILPQLHPPDLTNLTHL